MICQMSQLGLALKLFTTTTSTTIVDATFSIPRTKTTFLSCKTYSATLKNQIQRHPTWDQDITQALLSYARIYMFTPELS